MIKSFRNYFINITNSIFCMHYIYIYIYIIYYLIIITYKIFIKFLT